MPGRSRGSDGPRTHPGSTARHSARGTGSSHDSHLLGLIEPDDIASMALYLASDESRMVTGQVLPVDSGVTIS